MIVCHAHRHHTCPATCTSFARSSLEAHRESAFDEIFYQPLLDFSQFDSVSVIHDWNDDVRRRLINVIYHQTGHYHQNGPPKPQLISYEDDDSEVNHITYSICEVPRSLIL
jgi:hypothetical protein